MPPSARSFLRGLIVVLLAVQWPSGAWSAPASGQAVAPPAAAAAPEVEPQPPKAATSVALQVPAFDESFEAFPVARIAGEEISLRELMEGLAASHEDRKAGQATRSDFRAVLDRIIDVRLFVLEARAAGLDETPKFKEDLAAFKVVTARSIVEEQAARDAKPDPAEVEEIFKASVREWKIRSLLFDKEEGAKEFLGTIEAGTRFEDAVAKALAEKKAKGTGEVGDFIPVSKLQGAVKAAVESMRSGDVSPPLRVAEGWTVLRLEEARYPEDAAARAAAEAQSRTRTAALALRNYHLELEKKYVKKHNRKLFDQIDFHARRPGFKKYLEDRRVLVEIEGEPPITVGQFTKEVASKFFHGMDEPIKTKKVNVRKKPTLDYMVYRAVFDKEARVRRVEDTLAFRRAVEDWENGQLFGAYLEKAVAPSVELKEEELKVYYEANRKEFSTPAFYTIDGIGFATPEKAQAALERLKAGTDFKWLKQNADGQVGEGKRDPDLEGKTVIESSMPAELVKALGGAKAGDNRLYASPTGASYVLLVSGHVPEQARPYEEVREAIRKKVFGKSMQAAITEWAAKLRQGYEVEVFITRLGT
jgi:parvulin-like peptidyl-prolyl isomerase